MPGSTFLTQFPVDPTAAALTDLQGNILKGHGRQFTFHLFLSFKPNKQKEVRNWLADFSAAFVTSARQQLDDTKRFHDERIPGGLFTSVLLSAAGYAYLGVEGSKMPKDPRFTKGMQASGSLLKDPAPSTWHKGLNGTDGAIHALLLLADADVHQARSLARAIKLSLVGKADVVAQERGVVLRNAKGEGIEHNNYVDGISQPVFFANEMPAATDQWNPQATPALMLVPDPGGKFGENSLGSYFVFRKLEQNVRGFKTREKEVAKAVFNLPADPAKWTPAQQEQAELIGAWAVGRFEDGTPVLLHGEAQNPALNKQENNFNFAATDSASKCPFHAHIRKSAPRTDVGGAVFNKAKRLVRRGIPYEDAPRVREADGNLSDNPADMPTGGVGLLFMCYVADIAGQFEFVQKDWVNAPNFAQTGTGKDPLIGQPTDNTMYHWPPAYGDTTHPKKDVPFGDFIAMRGGEYFFAPCLSMLQSLRVLPQRTAVVGTKVPVLTTVPTLPKPGEPVTLPHPEVLVQLNGNILAGNQKVSQLDPILQLFIPDKADIGAGVVNVA
jgi:Dyp-type peroxidase family